MLKRVQYIDDIVLDKIVKLHTPRRNKIMTFITRMGNMGIVWFAMCMPFLIYRPWRSIGVNFLVGLVIAHLTGEICIKHIVCRVRPCHKLDDDELIVKRPRYYSFPSGHTTASFSVVAVAWMRCWPVAIPVTILAFLIGFSRVYLRVHYLTDVVAGAVLGLFCGFLSVELLRAMF